MKKVGISKKKSILLMTPGPVNMPSRVYSSLSEPVFHHRSPLFKKTLLCVFSQLKILFRTAQPVFVLSATGTGAMEAAVVNTLSPKEEVLVVVSGKFGERWVEIAHAYGLKTVIIKVALGQAVDPDVVESYLRSKKHKIKAVFCQYCETSTAIRHPIREIAKKIKHDSSTLLIVDAITALGVLPLQMDSWGLDVVVGGAQKGLMAPAGLSFIALSAKAWKFAERSKLPKFYFNLLEEKKAYFKGETHFSTPVSLVTALHRSLTIVLNQFLLKQSRSPKETALKQRQRYADFLARLTRQSCSILRLKLLSVTKNPSITAFYTPDGVDSRELIQFVQDEAHIMIVGGQGDLQKKIIRIGHMGMITPRDLKKTFLAILRGLERQGHPVNMEQKKRLNQLFLKSSFK